MLLSLNNLIILFVCAIGIYTTILFYISFFENSKRIEDPKPPKILPTVTICVPFYNENKGTLKTLDSLLSLNYPKNKIKIILVNDGSTDESYKIVKDYIAENKFANVKLLSYDKNKGKHVAVNLAIENCTSEIFGVLDADSLVDKDALIHMIGYFRDKKVVAVTPSMKVIPKGNILQRVQEAEYFLGVWLRKVFSYMDSIHVTPGPFSIFKKSFFDKYGNYKKAHQTEDIEMALRIQSKNYRIENSLNAHVYTSGPKTLKTLNNQRLRWYAGFMKNTFDYKHLFNKKYENLGLVFLPLAYLSVFIVIISLGYQIIKLLINSYDKIKVIILSNFDIFRFDWNLDKFFINVGPITLIAFVSIVLMIIMLYHAFLLSNKEKTNILLSILCFMLLYYFLYAYWWVSSISSVIRKKELSWNHKSEVS